MSIFVDKHYPEQVVGHELDLYLDRGWYRMGQTMFTTHFLCFNTDFFSALWIRQDLENYKMSKSLRKLMRRNAAKYKTVVQPICLDREKEALFQVYKEHFPEQLGSNLVETLQDGGEDNIFDTYEVAVYYDDQLVAYSFFDHGKESIASIMGVYDPAYKKDSLGLYTMLLEVTYCMENGLRFFYPGYVVPGNARFDYKLRLGDDIDYYDLSEDAWLPFSELSLEETPINRIQNKLAEANEYLVENYQIRLAHYYYPLFEANLFGYWQAPYFNYPEWLLCATDNESKKYLVLVFNPIINKYQLIICSLFEDFKFFFNQNYLATFSSPRFFMELLIVEQLVATVEDVRDIKESIDEFI